MPPLPIPVAVLYAGLAGVLLALIVATAQNKWQWRVFALLALRLAIGWHFCFEGLHKLQSMAVGASDTNRPFTSEPYFTAGEGPFAEIARKQFIADPDKLLRERLAKKEEVSADEFRAKSETDQAWLCPEGAAAELRNAAKDWLAKVQEDAAKLAADADAMPAGTPEEKNKQLVARQKADRAAEQVKLLENDAQPLRAKYAAWVYGIDRRPTKIKGIESSPPDVLAFTGPQALAHVQALENAVAARVEQTEGEIGHGTGTETKRTTAIRTELNTAKADLAAETTTYLNELRAEAGVPPIDAPKPDAKADAKPPEKPIRLLDTITAWTVTLVGVGLLAGLFTRLWCVVGAGFLVLTYLSAPPFPWLPAPPPSEGNPLFINKNLIEAIALVVILAHPTGRWLGLDAIWQAWFFKPKPDSTV